MIIVMRNYSILKTMARCVVYFESSMCLAALHSTTRQCFTATFRIISSGFVVHAATNRRYKDEGIEVRMTSIKKCKLMEIGWGMAAEQSNFLVPLKTTIKVLLA